MTLQEKSGSLAALVMTSQQRLARCARDDKRENQDDKHESTMYAM
jgi:hypothetical protein